MKQYKLKPTKLPVRRVLDQLGKSKMTIQDYAKVTPSNPTEFTSPALQQLRKRPYAGA